MASAIDFSTLYLCYFGIREPLVRNQVLPYLRLIAESGIQVNLLTFEPILPDLWEEQEKDQLQADLDSQGISWHYLQYHKRPAIPATMWDIFAGAATALRLISKKNIRVLHSRSHIPLAMALMVKLLKPVKLVFDIRGLMAEEYVDNGIWSERSPAFRAIKWLERQGLEKADKIVVLTKIFQSQLLSQGVKNANHIQVIPCCVDLSSHIDFPGNPCPEDLKKFEVIYAGSVTGLYLLEEMGRFFLEILRIRPDAFFRILTAASPDYVKQIFDRTGLSLKNYSVSFAKPEDVNKYLQRAVLGVSFRKPTVSQIAASPTKIPEYLAAGIPVVCGSGIGDMEELLESSGTGIILRSFEAVTFAEAARNAVDMAESLGIRNRCLTTARKYFDLETVGGARYVQIYDQLMGNNDTSLAS
jgi:glycosyltransferase involved in cell wall biosynthesis